MFTKEAQTTVAGLFTQWQSLMAKVDASSGSQEEAELLNAQRLDVEDAIAGTAPTTLDDLARKVMVAGAFEGVQTIDPTVLATEAAQLLGLRDGAPQPAGLAAMFDEWVRRNRELPRSDRVGPEEWQQAVQQIAELEDTILIAPSLSMLDVFRKVIIASDGTPRPSSTAKDEWLVVEAYKALGLPLAPIGMEASQVATA